MCVEVLINEDGIVEEDETFQLMLLSDDPAVLIMEPNITEITIINTDGKYQSMKILKAFFFSIGMHIIIIIIISNQGHNIHRREEGMTL